MRNINRLDNGREWILAEQVRSHNHTFSVKCMASNGTWVIETQS